MVKISVVHDSVNGTNVQPQWRLLNASGVPVAGVCGSFNNYPLSLERDCSLSATGLYQVEVQDKFRDGTGTYRIHLQRLKSSTACQTTALNCGATLVRTIGSPVDTDLFRFNVTEGRMVNINVVHDPVNGTNVQPQWRLLNASGVPVAGVCESFNNYPLSAQRACGPLPASGSPYQVEVQDKFRDGTGTYRITRMCP